MNLDRKQREEFDNDLYTPPEYRAILRRVNATTGGG